MNIKWKIIKPPIPIIFLDTFFFIDLVKNSHKNKNFPYLQEELRLVDLIIKLTKDKKLLCPQGDQKEEYELCGKEEEVMREQKKLSIGIRLRHYFGVYQYQVQKAMKEYIKNEKEIECDYMCLFYEDPVKELEEKLSGNFILYVHPPMPETYLNERRRRKKAIAKEIEEIRKRTIGNGIKYEDCVRNETLGERDFIKNSLFKLAIKTTFNLPLDESEIEGGLRFGELSVYYSRYSERKAVRRDIFDFLESEHFASIPYISIRSRLLCSSRTQQGEVKESDIFDFIQASQILPFSTYFLTDSSLKHRLTNNPLRLDEEYNVKIYSIKEVKELIRELESL